MKLIRFTLLFALSFSTIASFAQAPAKGSSNKAKAYLDKGEVENAKTEIENAVAYETYKLESKGKPVVVKTKTLLVQGLVFSSIATNEETPSEEVIPAIETAMGAFNKIKEQEKVGSTIYNQVWDNKGVDFATGQITPGEVDVLFNAFFQKGADGFNEKIYLEAIDGFEKSLLIKADTNAAKYGFYAAALAIDETSDEAQVAALEEKAKFFIKKQQEMGFYEEQQYFQLIRFEQQKAAPFEEVMTDAQYDIKEAKGEIEKLQKDYDRSSERATYYSKGGGRRYSGARQKAATAQKEADAAKKELEAQKARITEIEAKVAEAKVEANKMYEECLKVAIAGTKQLPESSGLASQMVAYYSKLDRLGDAVIAVEKTLETSPDDAMLNFNLAILYDQLSDQKTKAGETATADEMFAKADAQYRKAMSLDPEKADIPFNLGAMYYNKARNIYKEMNDLPRNSTGDFSNKAKADALQGQINEFAAKAEPAAIKATEVAPEETRYLNLLVQIYNISKQDAKRDAAYKKLEALEN